MWPKRKPSSPGSVARSGRISSLRTSESRCAPTSGRSGLGQERRDGAAVEEPPSTEPRSSHRALLLGEPVDARREQRLQGRRHLELAVAALRLHRDELLDEERVALGCLDDPLPRLLGRSPSWPTSALAVVSESASSVTRSRSASAPSTSAAASKRSGRAVHRTRSGTSCAKAATYSMRSRNAGSAQWMSSKTTTSGPPRQRLEQPADAPGDLLGRDRACPSRRARPRSGYRGELGVASQPPARREIADLRRDLLERPVGDALAVREAAADDTTRAPRPSSSRARRDFPMPGRPDDRRQLRRPRLDGRGERVSSCSSSLRRPTNGASIGRVNAGTSSSSSSTRKAGTGSLLPFSVERLDRLRADRVTHEALGRRPDQDLAGGGRLLEPGGDVHGVARGERLAGAGDDLARVDADAHLELPRSRRRPASRSRPEPRGARRPRAPAAGRRSPSPRRPRTSRPCRRGARGSPRSSAW